MVPEVRIASGVASARLGDAATAERILQELVDGSLRTPWTVDRAALPLALGRREEALELLERGLAESDKWLMWLGVDPRFDALRKDRRFERILAATGLPG